MELVELIQQLFTAAVAQVGIVVVLVPLGLAGLSMLVCLVK